MCRLSLLGRRELQAGSKLKNIILLYLLLEAETLDVYE
jgi:hypothetical protein